MPEMLLYQNMFGEQAVTRIVGKCDRMKLFPLKDDEARFLVGMLESSRTEVSEVSTGSKRRRQMPKVDLKRIAAILKSGGLNVYVGSVADQEGDSSWELTSSLLHIQTWADDMDTVSFEVPRTYRVSVTRKGFGAAKRLKVKSSKFR